MQHVKRWITALVLGPLVLWILFKGSGFLVMALLSAVAILSIREYLQIIFNEDDGPVPLSIQCISFAISPALVVGAAQGRWPVMFLVLCLNLVFLSVFVLFRFPSNPRVFDIISKQFLGIVYIPVSLSLLLFMRALDGGVFWIIWMLIVIFANDTGAFYTGTYLGKHKLAPRISPNKTVEGSIGGLCASIVAGFVFCLLFFNNFSLALWMIPCSLAMAVAGQVGDLFESAMKRASGTKDSGRILPGHGGMLDRIDGLLLGVPVLYAYLVYFI